MTTKYISPTTRIIWVALDGMLMDSGIKNVNPQSTETYDVTDDSDNWF